jgi:hypothetical protein
VHVCVMREGMKVKLTIQFAQFRSGGIVTHTGEYISPISCARHLGDNSDSTWHTAAGTFCE